MKTKNVSKLMLFALAFILLGLNGCTYDEGPAFSLLTKKMRLTGEWEVVKINDAETDGDFIVEFDKNGDYKATIDFGSFKETVEGEWDWADSKESIEITVDGDKEEWKVTKLKNSELWFDDENDNAYECEKM